MTDNLTATAVQLQERDRIRRAALIRRAKERAAEPFWERRAHFEAIGGGSRADYVVKVADLTPGVAADLYEMVWVEADGPCSRLVHAAPIEDLDGLESPQAESEVRNGE